MTELAASVKWLLGDIERFSARAGGIRLRAYQKAAAHAILGSVLGRQGRSFVVIFPRQSGKNELQAQIECYLLLLLSQTPAEIVKISPTLRPQAQNAMFRLRRALQRNPLTRLLWAKEHDRTFRIGQARISFLASAFPGRVLPFTFNMASKSKLGWGFLNLVDAGRWQEPAEVDILPEQARLQRLFFRQAEACTQQLLPGANRLMRWSVPESARDPQTHAPLHDDLLLSAALAAALDERDWQPGSAAAVIRTPDPLKELDHGF